MRAICLAVVLALLTTGCSGTDDPGDGSASPSASAGSGATGDGQPGTAMPEFDPSRLPDLPPPATLTGTKPAARAKELVKATSDAVDVGAGWLAAYAELAVPVIDPSGRSTSADGDPIGPRWDMVWAVGAMSRGSATIPLTDAARVLGWDETSPADPEQLLADLRAAAVSTDPRAQMFGQFVARKSVANGGADPTDAKVTPDQVWLDAATLHLIDWVIARQVIADTLTADVLDAADAAATPARFAPADPSAPCSEVFGSSEATSWINFIAGKLGGGTGIEEVASMPGIVEKLVEKLKSASQGEDAGKEAGARAAAMINKLNLVASILSMIAQINALRIGSVMAPDRLERHRQNTDGKTASIRVDIYLSSETFNGNDPSFCLLSLVANALGVGLSMPADGANLSGVEVIVTPGKNFPEKVYFADGGNRKRTTDATGSFTVGVQGRARRKTLPQSAPAVDDEFGLNFASQLEEVTAQSLINIFIDGLQLHKGGLSAAINIAKTLHYDLGELIYPMRDYGGDLRLSGDHYGYVWNATKCGGAAGTWEFTIVRGDGYLPTGGKFTLDREPLEGEPPVQALTSWVRFYDTDTKTGYRERFYVTFHADGKQTSWGAPAGSPALGIDEISGAGGLPITVGSFC